MRSVPGNQDWSVSQAEEDGWLTRHLTEPSKEVLGARDTDEIQSPGNQSYTHEDDGPSHIPESRIKMLLVLCYPGAHLNDQTFVCLFKREGAVRVRILCVVVHEDGKRIVIESPLAGQKTANNKHAATIGPANPSQVNVDKGFVRIIQDDSGQERSSDGG